MTKSIRKEFSIQQKNDTSLDILAITVILATMPFSASLADDFTRAICSLSESFCIYSVQAKPQDRCISNNKHAP